MKHSRAEFPVWRYFFSIYIPAASVGYFMALLVEQIGQPSPLAKTLLLFLLMAAGTVTAVLGVKKLWEKKYVLRVFIAIPGVGYFLGLLLEENKPLLNSLVFAGVMLLGIGTSVFTAIKFWKRQREAIKSQQ